MNTKTNQMNGELNTPLFEEIIHRICSVSTPDRIILFGSRARGTQRSDSDIDLLVIIPGVELFRQEGIRLRRALRGLLVPIDVVVATPEQIERHRNTLGLIYAPALKEGVVLYDRFVTNESPFGVAETCSL